MAIDLDILVPADINRVELVKECIARILSRAEEEGLPFSKYDLDDLKALPMQDLQSLGTLLGIKAPIKPQAILKKGLKVYRSYTKLRPNNPTALLLPSLLPIIARAAREATLR